MVRSTAGGASAPAPSGWVVWGILDDETGGGGGRWLDRLRLDSFRFLMGIAVAALAVLAVRYLWFTGTWSRNYVANAIFFLGLFVLVSWRPAWHRTLSWLGMAAFLASALIGLGPYSARVFVPTHMLLPLIVLYAALLGDVWMGVVATLAMVAFYLKVGIEHWPLEASDLFILMNLCGVTVLAGLGTFGVWRQHRRFAEAYRLQAASLQRELDARLRLNAILFHDIRNPLAALTSALDLVKESPRIDPADMALIEEMAGRIWTVIDSAREIGRDVRVQLSDAPVGQFWTELNEVFEPRLVAKGLKLARGDGGELVISTHHDILFSSVLSNIMNNAIKFSPRGSTIELAASKEGDCVRMEVRDGGEGFSTELLDLCSRGGPHDSSAGTEGEMGHAYGLRIASVCLRRLGGQLQIRNRPGGGASVAVLLPAGR